MLPNVLIVLPDHGRYYEYLAAATTQVASIHIVTTRDLVIASELLVDNSQLRQPRLITEKGGGIMSDCQQKEEGSRPI